MNISATAPRGILLERPLCRTDLAESKVFESQTLKRVVIWSLRSLDTRQWRTGFEFIDALPVIPTATQGPPQPSGVVVSTLLHPGIYSGLSVDMYQPFSHQFYVRAVDGPTNPYGTLSIKPRLKDFMYPRKVDSFTLEFTISVRVMDLLDLILDERRQYYKFDPQGSGSLHWQLQLLQACVARGWISQESFNVLLAHLIPFKVHTHEGVFYEPPKGM